MADLKISALNSLAGADLVAADVVAVVDDSASETKKLTVSDLIANGTTLISDATIPSAKILFAAGAIDTAELAASAVETAKINDSAVTAAKLADNSSVTLVSTLPASGDFTGQIALDTDDDKIYVWDGSAWDSVKGAGSINVVNGSTSGIVNITTSTSGDTVTVSTTLDDTTAAKQFLAGPTGAGGTVGYRAIASGDLPTATSSAKGAVAVNGNGLTMNNDEIQIDNSVTAETTEHHLVQYDANGLITAGRVIAASDLPEATSSAKGAVVPGSGLSVASGGTLNHTNSTTAGTYTKVTVDAQGHVTSAVTLAAADIPDLDAAKITTGTFPTARLADDAVTAAKLADQSVTKFGGAGATDNVVTFPDGDYKGQFFFDEKNEDLYVYTGESFLPITVISGNLVNAGTYDASTNLLSSVTTAGSAAGFTNGAALPAPASGNLNYYVVVDTSGTGSGNAPAVALAPPDMLISLGVAGTTFQLIDVSNAIAGQTAANISVVATGNIAATDVQAALQELDTEKLAKAGGTMTGNLELGDGIVIVFEGATDDGFETTLTVADPTADRTITLPNETGTVVTTGSSGVVTSTMITDGTIVNADINASAEIAVSKLANGSARQLLQTDTAGTGVEFTSNVDVPGTFDVTGAATFDSTAAVTGALTVTGVINADGKVKFPAGTASAPSFYNGTDTDTGLYFSAANEISVATGGTQRIVVDSSGQVGIGTSSPSGLLHISGNTCQMHFTDEDDSSSSRIYLSGSTFAIDADHGNSKAGTVLAFRTDNAERARIDTSGNLGVGTTSPTSLGGNFREVIVSGATEGAGLQLQDIDGNVKAGLFTSDISGAAFVRTITNHPLGFRTNNTERMRIDSSGRVGIGVDSMESFSSGANTLVVGTTSGSAGITINTGAADQTGSIFFAEGTGANAVGRIRYEHANNAMLFSTSNTERLRIDSSGNVIIGTGSLASNVRLRIKAENSYKSLLQFADQDDDNVGEIAYNHADNTLAVSVNDSERLRIDSSGNVGINFTPPSDVYSGTKSVYVNDRAAIVGWKGALDEATSITNNFYYNSAGSNKFIEDGYANKLDLRAGTLRYSVSSASGTAGATASINEKFRVDSSGRVIIGATNPDGFKFKVTESGGNLARFTNGATQTMDVVLDSSGVTLQNPNNGYIAFKGSSTERMRIESSGRVIVKNSSVGEIDALTSASTITPDFAASNNFSVTLGTNATLANPSNLTAGQSGVIAITQDGTGSRTLAYGNKFKFAGGTAPTLTTTASAVDILTYYVESTSRITAQVLLNVS